MFPLIYENWNTFFLWQDSFYNFETPNESEVEWNVDNKSYY